MSANELAPRYGGPIQSQAGATGGVAPSNLADILERVLDKGIVIAGDIQINLLDIELLTIKLRLLIASVDRAREMGINWWEGDSSLSSDAQQLQQENQSLRERLERLEQAAGLPSGESDKSQSGGGGKPRGAR
jgi:Gas vesicle protein